jgi:3-phosphoshikimate 1-carboxyvinyltransferase
MIDDSSDPWLLTGSEGRLVTSPEPIDAGASGLTARALIAVAPLVDGSTVVVGRDRLPERPMAGLVGALADLGVEVAATSGRLPVTVLGTGSLPGGEVTIDSHETTQFLSAMLMAAPLAASQLTLIPAGIEGSQGYIAVTLKAMSELGASVEEVDDGYRVSPTGYRSADIDIEPDASAAVYPMVAAAITGSRVVIDGLGALSLQPDLAVADVLASMGCDVSQDTDTTTVVGPGRPLRPVDVDLSGCPDGSLAVSVACLYADGESRLSGLGSLRFKESDRLTALATEIERLGAGARIEGDSLLITPASLRPAVIETYGDHRVAMSFGLIGLAETGIEITSPEVVGKTWPEYWDLLESLDRENP